MGHVMKKILNVLKLFKKKKTSDQSNHHDDISNDANNNDDKYSYKRKKEYGRCPTCNRYNTEFSWCQTCDPQLLTQGWTSGNEAIDKLIENTQLKATEYNNDYYFQWIPYYELKDIL